MWTEKQAEAERRLEARRAASGGIRLQSTDPVPVNIEGVLLDTSPHGFRAAHNCPILTTGQTVWFHYSGGSGRARVIWTRVAEHHVQSGFYVLP